MPFDISRENQPKHFHSIRSLWWWWWCWCMMNFTKLSSTMSKFSKHFASGNVCWVLKNLYSASLSLNYCQNIIQNLLCTSISFAGNWLKHLVKPMQELPGAFPPGDSLGFCPGPTAETFARRKRVKNYFFPFQWSLGCRPCKDILDKNQFVFFLAN